MNKQNTPDLGQLYRTAAAQRDRAPLDADLLAEATAGALDQTEREQLVASLATSPAHADLYRLLQDLQPASAALAADLAAEFPATVVPFQRPSRQKATMQPMRRGVDRRWGWLAVAASVVTAVLIALPRHGIQGTGTPGLVQQQRATPAVGDIIFRAEMGSRVASNDAPASGDVIFSGRFNGS